MKRYLGFAGDVYYPAGGWDDFIGDFDTIEEANKAMPVPERYQWNHVIDTKTMKEVDSTD